MSAEHDFHNTKYAVKRSVLADDDRTFLAEYLRTVCAGFSNPKGDSQVPGTPFAYAETMMERLLEKLLPTIEGITGLSLYPTYSYVRLYKLGDELHKHRDRAACEISASLCIFCNPPEPWPIWIESQSTALSVSLSAGDMLVYRGCEVSHWRYDYKGELCIQAFLHYVDRHGPFSDWRFDRRPSLSTASIGR